MTARYPPRPTNLEEPDFDDTPHSRRMWTALVGTISYARLANWSTLDSKPRNFLGSSHDIDLPGEWVGEQLLGDGGYGSVGLWRQRDENGLVLDEMAIKQTELHPLGRDLIMAWLQREAAVQRDLQRMEADMKASNNNTISEMIRSERYDFDPSAVTSRNIVHLRNYKLNRQAELTRLYQINCGHGSLAALIARYRAFDQLIPEPFIWHVFHSLSIANLLLSEPPHASSPWLAGYEGIPRFWFCLHRDIKPENIFLDYAPTRPEDLSDYYDSDDLLRDVTRSYPVVALGDFGLSTYTSALPGLDPSRPTWGGTTGYHPPEQQYVHVDEDHLEPRVWRRFGERFNPPIYRADQPWRASHNIWCIAKIMLDMTLGYSSDIVHPKLSALTEPQFQDNGRHFISQWEQERGRRRYSGKLLNLIYECTYPEERYRPLPRDVVTRTANGLRDYLTEMGSDEMTKEARLREYRLYYRGREIEELGYGRIRYGVDGNDYRAARRGLPVDQSLRFPPAKWGAWEDQYRAPDEPRQFVHQGNAVNFGRDPADEEIVIHEDSPHDGPNGDQPQNAERHGPRSALPARSPLARPEPSLISAPVLQRPMSEPQPGPGSNAAPVAPLIPLQPPEPLQPSPAQQPPQQPPQPIPEQSNTQAETQQPPTREEYMEMTVAEIVIELRHRKHGKDELKRLQKSKKVKKMYVDLLLDADAVGKRGRGVYKPNHRRRK